MKNALQQTGLPSRGNSDDLSNIEPPRAVLVAIDDLDVEYMDVGIGEPVLFVHGAPNDLINFVEALDAGPVHLVSWSSGVRTALVASLRRPDPVKSAIHFEPFDDSVFADDDDPQLKKIQEYWFSTWGPTDERLEAGDLEGGAARLIEKVFEIEPGAFEQEREL